MPVLCFCFSRPAKHPLRRRSVFRFQVSTGSKSSRGWDSSTVSSWRVIENPHNYYVDLSQKLWDLKQELLKARR